MTDRILKLVRVTIFWPILTNVGHYWYIIFWKSSPHPWNFHGLFSIVFIFANAVKWIFYSRTILCEMAWHNYKDCCEEAFTFWTSTRRERHKSKKQNTRTTSFSHSIRRNQDCNGQCNHLLGAPASFMPFGHSFLFNLR